MKKVAIIKSNQSKNTEAVLKHLNNKFDITCLNEIDEIEESIEYFSKNKFDLIILDNYTKNIPKEVFTQMGQVINIHPSLLPAFECPNAIKEAFFAGVKVSGITIHWVEENTFYGKIITQFPVFITHEMTYPELENEIYNTQKKLYPIVIEKIIEDKVFDFQELMKSNCSKGDGGCSSGCNGCKS